MLVKITACQSWHIFIETQCTNILAVPSVPPPLQLPQHVSLKPQLIHAPRTKAMDSVYSEHAREGFVYWLTDKVKGSCGKCAGKPLIN